MSRRAALVIAAVLAAVTGYELAVALGALDQGSLPGEGAPGGEVVGIVAAIAFLVAAFLAVVFAGARRSPAAAALFAPLTGAFLVAHFYTFDPYYLPTLRRMSEGGMIPPVLVFLIAGAAIAAGLVTLLRPRAGLALSAPLILACGLTASFAGVGH